MDDKNNMQANKIIGLACGRKNGNSEILLKEALMGADELGLGISSEIIRLMDLKIQPCRGCQACGGPGVDSKDNKCILHDDVEWVLEKTMLEKAALIISFPIYHLQINGHLKMVMDRMNHIFMNNMEIFNKKRVGAIISVGGSGEDWTTLAFATANIFLQHTRKLVDQMQVINAPLAGDVLFMDAALSRARKLGKNVARALITPIDDVKYAGIKYEIACPVCHCNLLSVPARLPEVYCPVCWTRGEIVVSGAGMKVKWDKHDIKYPRFSLEAHLAHFEDGSRSRKAFEEENKDRFSQKRELLQKYTDYGYIVKP
ncbi:MAG: flavodoxin family protein [Dehalococcoidales bacterium]|nr:flavodoxin family protein [Dehalococcoidales bacterium]